MKADQLLRSKVRTGPLVSLLSRTPIASLRSATSMQSLLPPPLERVLFRHSAL